MLKTSIYCDIDSMAAVVADFKIKVASAAPSRLSGLCGFDGFIDNFVRLQAPDSMAEFGPKVAAAAGVTTSFPVRYLGDKFGGNAPLFAAALNDIQAGEIEVTLIAAMGRGEVLPIFQAALGGKTKRLLTLAAPAYSTCLEFTDGKVMLNDMAACAEITWERLLECSGQSEFDEELKATRFTSAVNWGKLPYAGEIWSKLADRLAELGVRAKQVFFFMAVLIFPSVGGIAKAEFFGIHFLGNTTDRVIITAGVVPVSGWNNITNQNNVFTSGTIHSSDGAVFATLTLSGSGRANGWNSGTAADGGNGSLMRGYCDAMANSPATVTISGLTGSSYTIYLYNQADAQRPGGSGDWIPNYTINGSTIYTPTLTPPFNRFVQGGMTLDNTNTFPTGLANGNYIRWNNGVPVNGVITISANADNRSFRSPLNGIELVLNTNPPPSQTRPIRIMPLGDSITWGYPDAPTTGGYRLPLYQLLTNANVSLDFVGTQVSTAPGLPYPNHEGHSGFRIDQIDDPYFLGWVNTVASPDIILLLIGTNDIGQNDDPTNAIVRLDALISHITSDCPNAKLVVANLLPRSDTNDNNEINTLFNPFVPGLVAKHVANGEQVYFRDLHSAITLSDTDGLHPTPAGYIKIGRQWFDAFNSLYAPLSGLNLALNKPITASSVQGSNVASNAVDGNAATYWFSAPSDPQWISVDLGATLNVNRVRWIWTSTYGKSYQVQVSTDNVLWSNVYNTTNGQGGTNSVSFAPKNARYVRIYGTQRDTGLGYAIEELQVFATPLINLALNKNVSASSTSDAVNFPASKAVDGDSTTHWSSTSHDGEWIAVDLGSMQSVGWVRLNWDAAYGQSYEIQVSTNNLDWTRVCNTGSGTGGIEDISFTAVSARYVRMYGLQRGTGNGYSLNEFGVYASPNAPMNSQFPSLIYVPNVNAVLNQINPSIGLSWHATVQQTYGIQYTTNLAASTWFDYEPQVTATGSVANVLLPLNNEPQKFFRVKPAF